MVELASILGAVFIGAIIVGVLCLAALMIGCTFAIFYCFYQWCKLD